MRSIAEIRNDFLEDLDKWQSIVRQHGLDKLQRQPEPNQWSIGQVINHFIIETEWYFEQARKAIVDTQNLQKPKSTMITKWFDVNSFPDVRFKGPEDLENPKQPKSKKELVDKIERLKNGILDLAGTLSTELFQGKAEHPGHQFLTAQEWFQYAEMHCRHHFRQKGRIKNVIDS